MTTERDELLYRSRRVDWRFLLPDADLGHVALVGAAADDDELAAAVEALAARCDRDPQAGSAPDLAVARGGHAETYAAAGLVRPGGAVYIETSGRRARRVATIARTLGLVDVVVRWHWPDHAGCLEIVDLDDPVAVRHALGRRGAAGGGGVRGRVATVALALGVFDRTVAAASVLAWRPAT